MMRKVVDFILFFLFAYPAGIVIGIRHWLLRIFGTIKVKGWENFPSWTTRVLVVSNHPSLEEPSQLIGMFLPQYLLRPFKYGPKTLADKENYYDHWKYRLVRMNLIPVDRSLLGGDPASLSVAARVLEKNGIVIMYPEGGRTFKGNSHLGIGMKKIRPLKKGFAYLASQTGALVVPIWVEGSIKSSMTIVIGKPQSFRGEPCEKIVEKIEKTLLALGLSAS